MKEDEVCGQITDAITNGQQFWVGGFMYDTGTGHGISGEHCVEQKATAKGCVCAAMRARMKRKRSLYHTTLESATLWTVGVFVSAHWTPY